MGEGIRCRQANIFTGFGIWICSESSRPSMPFGERNRKGTGRNIKKKKGK
jgi:hypothetical protein